jgi:iron complex outermembrane receptor protein
VEATYGSLDRVDVRASADLAIVPEKLFMRIAGVSKHHDGYVDRIDYACANPGSGLLPQTTGAGGCKLGTEGGQSMNSVRAAMRWLVTDKIEVNLAGDFTSDNSEVQANTLLGARTIPWITGDDGDPATPPVVYGPQFIPADPYVTYSTFTDPGGVFAAFGPPGATVTKQAYQIPPVNTLKAWGTSGTIDWQLTETLSMKSITAYRAYRSDFAEDVDNSPLNAELVMNHLTHRQFSEEVRFNGSIGSAVDYTVGGFYFWQKSVNRNRVDIPYVAPQPVGTYFDFTSNDPVVAHSKSGFAHAIWHITDRLNLAGGVRYTAEDKDYTYSRLNPDGTPNPILGALTGVTGHFEGTRWDWRANADYQLTSEMMVYAQFSTGFKGGGINPRPFSVAQVKPFGPEQLDAYELGLKSYWLDRSVRVNISAFFNKYKDIQLTLLACPTSPCAQPNNAGDADVKGFEVETEIHPVEGLTIDGALSYLDFEYTRIDPNAGGPTQPAGVQVGMVTPFTPKWKWSVGAQYEFQMGDNGTLTPRVDASYQGAIFSGAVNCGPISPACAYADSNRVPAYTLVNGRVTWRSADRDWQASLQATNLTNKLYYYQIFDLLGLAGFQSGQPAAPRQWAVTVKRRF